MFAPPSHRRSTSELIVIIIIPLAFMYFAGNINLHPPTSGEAFELFCCVYLKNVHLRINCHKWKIVFTIVFIHL